MKDTGVNNVEENLGLYTQYVLARFADQNHRLLGELTNQIQEMYKVLRKV